MEIEQIKGNKVFEGLTDAQLQEIVTISNNATESAKATASTEFAKMLSSTFADVERGEEDNTAFLSKVAEKYKADFATKEAEISKQAKEVARLNKVIAEGGQEGETAKKLAQLKKDYEAVTTQYTELKAKQDQAEEEYNKKLFAYRIDSEFTGATKGLNYKSDISESAKDALTRTAIDKIKAMTPEYIDNGKGAQVLVFKGADGAILRNETNLNPLTLSELLEKELTAFGILATKQPSNGGGTKNPDTQTTYTGAKTQTEAYAIFEKQLLAQGLLRNSDEFQTKMNELYKENNILSLPLN